jgi:chemotaxis protein methyltransferase CheR
VNDAWLPSSLPSNRGSSPRQDTALRLLAELIHDHTGLVYDASRLDLLADKLSGRVAERAAGSLLDYYSFLRYDDQADEEWQRLQTALAVNETYFWREEEQMRAAAEILIPRFQRERPGAPLRIWHAACATGEEPYSMAILLDQTGAFDRGPVELLATDFNQAALTQARAASYRPRSFRQFPEALRDRYFQPDGGQFRLNDSIRARVTFAYLNLLDLPAMRPMGSFDLIFCRNAFIYFSNAAIQQVITAFHQALLPERYLCVAASESLLRWSTLFELVEVGRAFLYQRRAQGDENHV